MISPVDRHAALCNADRGDRKGAAFGHGAAARNRPSGAVPKHAGAAKVKAPVETMSAAASPRSQASGRHKASAPRRYVCIKATCPPASAGRSPQPGYYERRAGSYNADFDRGFELWRAGGTFRYRQLEHCRFELKPSFPRKRKSRVTEFRLPPDQVRGRLRTPLSRGRRECLPPKQKFQRLSAAVAPASAPAFRDRPAWLCDSISRNGYMIIEIMALPDSDRWPE